MSTITRLKMAVLAGGLWAMATPGIGAPASATGGGPATVHGGVALSSRQLRAILSYKDACYGPSSPSGPGASFQDQTPGHVTKWRACFPVQGGLTVDTQLSVGPTRVLVTNQGRMAFYDKSGTYHGSLTAAKFFDALGLDDGTEQGIDTFQDLRTVYDEYRGRFWVGAIAHNGRQTDASRHRAVVVVAVSQTSHPLGGWWLYWWDAVTQLGGVYQAGDRANDPFLGVSSFGLHQTNRVVNGGTRYWRVSFFRGNELANGTAAAGWQYWDLKNPDGTDASVVQPAVHHGASAYAYYASRQGQGDVVVWRLVNPLAPGQLVEGAAFTAEDVFRQPTNATQAGSWQKLRMDRMGTAVLKASYRNNFLHLVTNDAYNWFGDAYRTSVRLLRVNVAGFPSLPTDDASGFIDTRIGKMSEYDDFERQPHRYYGWPAVEVNDNGDMAVILSRSGDTILPEMRWALNEANATSHKATNKIQQGVAPYAIPNSGAAVLPWGETAGAAVDPSDDHAIWLAHQVTRDAAGPLGNYEIWVAKVLGEAGVDMVFHAAYFNDGGEGEPGMPPDAVARFINEGEGVIVGATVAFSLVREDGLTVRLGEVTGVTIRPGEIATVRGTFALPTGTPPGRYRAYVVGDPDNRLREYSETNNAGFSTNFYEVPAAP